MVFFVVTLDMFLVIVSCSCLRDAISSPNYQRIIRIIVLIFLLFLHCLYFLHAAFFFSFFFYCSLPFLLKCLVIYTCLLIFKRWESTKHWLEVIHVWVGLNLRVTGLGLSLGCLWYEHLQVFCLWLLTFPRDGWLFFHSGGYKSSCQPPGSAVGKGVRGNLNGQHIHILLVLPV